MKRKGKSKSNKIVISLLIVLLLNISFNIYLFYKIKKDEEISNLAFEMSYFLLNNDKDYQNDLQDPKKKDDNQNNKNNSLEPNKRKTYSL